ncbi:MAG: DUF92 domain-containing protein [Brevefilum sp.]|nr:DUF92 domain-containing protein [Brevefilum sp.]MDT8381978.1 DUF92 domain-containing protein [Brevefilum sp.]MDW7754483.1 DUF92 domain-containing protein [Brevefilum sp.]
MAKLLTGLLVALVIAYLAFRAKALNKSGGVAAALLGTIVFGLGGLDWALILLIFFISSSALSKFFEKKKGISGENFLKGSRRDAWQVAANGGMAGLLALSYFILSRFSPGSEVLPPLWIGFGASLAAANADTWGTELGLLNPSNPVLLSTFKRVPKGTSGGVSMVGTLASLGGSALVGGAVGLLASAGWGHGGDMRPFLQFLVITGSGLFGAFVDSLLGASLQAIYYCPVCKKETEQHPLHRCGNLTEHLRGLMWLNNDWVNAACTISAGIMGLLLAILLN